MVWVTWTFICSLMIVLQQYIAGSWTHSQIHSLISLMQAAVAHATNSQFFVQFYVQTTGVPYIAHSSWSLQCPNQGPVQFVFTTGMLVCCSTHWPEKNYTHLCIIYPDRQNYFSAPRRCFQNVNITTAAMPWNAGPYYPRVSRAEFPPLVPYTVKVPQRLSP